ncbi:Ig-like domain-containing protein [Paenibacillus planticolens]|uniref:Sulfatase-like hydrolase/transferase n=1 Tax=Paenibacillus planticolens TaxID=2654976 RepID=A0ABX1ZZ16_9BACL|nr:Ig-like domain-containing protein [Paenibacillus planticolens]NOV03945.1 sulfatase-like hydrolase/transferase [Paenibacillus planticolens]
MKVTFKQVFISTLTAALLATTGLPAALPFMAQTAYAEVAASDLALQLKFEDNAVDSSANDTSVTPAGNPTYVPGRVGKALNLTSTSANRQYLNLGKPANLQFGTGTSFTLAFWVKSPGVASDPPVISNKNWANGANVGYVLALQPNNSLKWNYNTQGGSRADAEIPNVADGKWHHIVVSHDRTTGRADFYKDGVPVAVSVKNGTLYQNITNSMNIAGRTGTIDAGLSTMIGNDGTGAYAVNTFDMQVDELQIIKRVVTAQEAGDMFNSAPPVQVNNNFNGSLNLIGAEHAVQGGTFRVNLDLRTPTMSTAVDKSVIELAYDSSLFEFVSATKAVSADTSTPGIVKLTLPGGIVYSQTNPLEYSKSRISEVFFRTKAASGQGQIQVNKAEFYTGTTKMVNETFISQPETVQIHPKATEDLNKDGVVTVGDLALAQGNSEDLQKQIAANAQYVPYKRVVVIGMDGGGVSVMPNAPYWETPSSPKEQVGSRQIAPNLRSLIEKGAASYTAKTTLPSSSSPNWGAMLNGVDFSKHQINNDDSGMFYYSETSPYPSVFKKVREALPNKKLAAFATWKNIVDGHIEPSVGVEVGSGGDEVDAAAFAQYVASGKALDTSLMFIQFDDMDHAGHSYGFYTKQYYEQLTKTDLNVGTIVNSLRDKNLLDDTLILMLPDHGGGTENANTTLGSATSHGQDSPLATTIFFAANGRTVATDTGKEKILQGGTTKDLAATVLKALGINGTIGDSQGINGMFVAQKDQNKADSPNLQLTKVVAPTTQQLKHYELAVSSLSSAAKAMDVVVATDGLNVTAVEPVQEGVKVLRSESANGRTRIVLSAENGITPDAALLKLQVTPLNENASAALETAVVANAQGAEALPNLKSAVREDTEVQIPATGVQVDKSSATVKQGETIALTAAVQPANASNKNVTWSSSDPTVASVENAGGKGIVTGLKTGTVTITATSVDGGFKATSQVTVEAGVPSSAKTTLSSSSSVYTGNEFVVRLGLSSVTSQVYAQDLIMNYDASLLDFVSVKSVKEKVSLIDTKKTAGQLRFILASEGAGNAVSGDAQLLEVTFRAKSVSQSASAAIAVASAILADGAGVETSATVSSVGVNITVGIPGDINHDGKVSIGDLAFAAAHYGKTTSSADWQEVKAADINGDGIIDIIDLAAIAAKILE